MESTELQLQLRQYKKRIPTPSSSLISLAFQNNALHRDGLTATSQPPRATRLNPVATVRNGAGEGPSAPKWRKGEAVISQVVSSSPGDLHRESSPFASLFQREKQLKENEQSHDGVIGHSLEACVGVVLPPHSHRGLWSSLLTDGGAERIGHDEEREGLLRRVITTPSDGSCRQQQQLVLRRQQASEATESNRQLVPFTPLALTSGGNDSVHDPTLREAHGTMVATSTGGMDPRSSRPPTREVASRPQTHHSELRTGTGVDPIAFYRSAHERLKRELMLLSAASGGAHSATDEERFRVYRECAHHLATQLEAHAPVLGTLFAEYDRYVSLLETKSRAVNAAEKETEAYKKKLEEERQKAETLVKQNEDAFAERVAAIQSVLKTNKNVEQMVRTIRGLETTIGELKSKCGDLERRLSIASELRHEFEQSIRHAEESFLTIANEREIELADYRRHKLAAFEEVVRVKDEARQTVADMQLRLDAQQIVLETQMQREQLTTDRMRDLQAYNVLLIQQSESLKKSLDDVMTKQTTAVKDRISSDDPVAEIQAEVDVVTSLLTAAAEVPPAVSSPTVMKKEVVLPTSVAGDPIDLNFTRLNTPRPNKAEIVARVPDLGDPQRYPSTNAIVQALLSHVDTVTKRLSDADFTLNKLEERIEIVVMARAELVAREKFEIMKRELQ